MKAVLSQRVLLPDGIRPACLIIENEKIKDIFNEVPEGFSGEVKDHGSHLISPGIVDPHVHINEPGRTDWEGFETATQAAAAGGMTTLMDMPLNCLPVTTTKKNLQTKLEALQGKLYVDCGFWGGVTPESVNDLEELLNAGVMGVKSFLIDSGIDEFPAMTRKDLDQAVPMVAKSGLPYLIHAELEEDQNIEVGSDYNSFLESRPRDWENKAIDLMMDYAREFKGRIHIVHLSSSDAISNLKKARAEGLKVSVETCPHYLIFSSEEIESDKTLFKCCPPIREKSNQDLLWKGLEDGDIDFICSDHSPCTANLKEGDFGKAWGGISSLQFSLPLIWTELEKRNLSLTQLNQWLSEKPAEFIGLSHRKGKIKKGFDADLVIWSPEEEFEIKEENILYKNKITPYSGRRVKGKVYQTYLRGQCVFKSGERIPSPTGQTLLRGQS